MDEVTGVHRRVVYRATFEEQDNQMIWHAHFLYGGENSQARGGMRGDTPALSNTLAQMHITMQLYIDAALLRGDFGPEHAG